MQLSLKSFSQLIEDMGAALQGSATSLVDVSVGSVLRAIFEANASVVLWLQWLVLQTLSMTRAATSAGTDLDSWMADFGAVRLAATPATGVLSFSRFATTLPALVPIGAIAKTADGLLSFAVTEDDTLSTWQQQSSGYVVPIGVTSADIPVTCLTAGSAGNVLPGTITTIASSIPGIDQVLNANAFTDGTDSESDQAFRSRFQSYLASRSRATLAAVQNAVSSVQQGLIFSIAENLSPDGTARPGSFLVIVDDGSGYPSADLLSMVASAVDLVRPIGTTFTVAPPVVLKVAVSLTAYVRQTDVTDNLVPAIEAQITAYLNSLQIGCVASATRVAMSAYSANTAIQNVTSVLLNGFALDVAPPAGTVIKAGEITAVVDAG
jgi:Baseplate J-like protein